MESISRVTVRAPHVLCLHIQASPAKIRLAFEAAPFGLLVEKAGGKTSDVRSRQPQ